MLWNMYEFHQNSNTIIQRMEIQCMEKAGADHTQANNDDITPNGVVI